MGMERIIENENEGVHLKNAFFHYGTKDTTVPVLVGLDMTIPKGSIYGLLGPSGCGKTTLIHCILGRKTLQSGSLLVFGGAPGSGKVGIPGARVGYMPQELALNCELTIKEMLWFFGTIFQMNTKKIANRSQLLIDLLDLPTEDRMIMNLSGGQRRRVSLAAALIHEPELLILDEPTVGVDPMLRNTIWTHLLYITKDVNVQTTVIITTHYIEEARQAHRVGMMRSGQLLVEGHPDQLLLTYQKSTLEELFVHLCIRDRDKKRLEGSQASMWGEMDLNYEQRNLMDIQENKYELIIPMDSTLDYSVLYETKTRRPYQISNLIPISQHRIRALIIKTVIRIRRNIMFLILMFIIPSLLFILYYATIGHNPTGITMAVFNEEVSTLHCKEYNYGCIFGSSQHSSKTDDEASLSCRYLSHLDKNVISPVFFDNLLDARQSVESGENWGVLHFKDNFTAALFNRLLQGIFHSDESPSDMSDINVFLDMANPLVYHAILFHLTNAYQDLSQDLLFSCNHSSKFATVPIALKDPIYGSEKALLTEFMAPGIILFLIYSLSVGFTALAFVADIGDKIYERFWACGVTVYEILLAHAIVNLFIMTIQIILVLIVMTSMFSGPIEGSIVLSALLILLQGVCGMSFGFVISCLCDSEQVAIQAMIASTFCKLFLSGIMWPLSGMSDWLRKFSYTLPNTQACEILKSIVSRGWNLSWIQVWSAFFVTILWIILFMLLAAAILKIRKEKTFC